MSEETLTIIADTVKRSSEIVKGIQTRVEQLAREKTKLVRDNKNLRRLVDLKNRAISKLEYNLAEADCTIDAKDQEIAMQRTVTDDSPVKQAATRDVDQNIVKIAQNCLEKAQELAQLAMGFVAIDMSHDTRAEEADQNTMSESP